MKNYLQNFVLLVGLLGLASNAYPIGCPGDDATSGEPVVVDGETYLVHVEIIHTDFSCGLISSDPPVQMCAGNGSKCITIQITVWKARTGHSQAQSCLAVTVCENDSSDKTCTLFGHAFTLHLSSGTWGGPDPCSRIVYS
jgi:hypothetical protein